MNSKELDIMIKAARYAGKILMKYYGKTTPKEKLDKSIITEADIKSEEKIRSILQKYYPEYSILGEELGYKQTTSDFVWAVDPLDGTTNFSMKIPLFSVSIALAYKGNSIKGVVYCPFTDEIFYAEKGKGAFLNGEKIKVSENNDIKKSFITFCHGNDKESIILAMNFLKKFKLINEKIRQLGSAAIELCYVASGRCEGYMIPGPKPWDIAAGIIIVEEAGGKVTNFNGKSIDIYTKTLLATNGKIHQELLKMLKI